MRKSRVALLCGALTFALAVPTMAVEVGDDAPEIDPGTWYNLPKGMKTIKAKDLKGQIVLIEFWATW